MATYLHQNRPMITGMIQKPTPEQMRFLIKNSIYDGADALGIQLETLEREYHTEEHYRTIFAACAGRPIYITNYRYAQNEGLSDEECMEDLIHALSCGATIGDIPGDTFDKGAAMELTHDPAAVEKQKALAARIHAMGKEVLFSSHILKYTPAQQVLEVALAQQERGADVVKIVTAGNSVEEQMENLRITTLLKEKLSVPFLYLSGGTHTKIHRMIGPMLGCVTWLAVHEQNECSVPTQPTIRAAKAVLDNFDFMPDIAG